MTDLQILKLVSCIPTRYPDEDFACLLDSERARAQLEKQGHQAGHVWRGETRAVSDVG